MACCEPTMRRTLDPITLRLFVAVCEERNIARAAAPSRTLRTTSGLTSSSRLTRTAW